MDEKEKTAAAAAEPAEADVLIRTPRAGIVLGRRVHSGRRCLLAVKSGDKTDTISLEELAAALYAGETLALGDELPAAFAPQRLAPLEADAQRQLLEQALFQPPRLLGEQKIDDLLLQLQKLELWIEEVFAYALQEAASGRKEWRDFKLVRAYGRHRFADPEGAARAASAAGMRDIYRLLTPEEFEKLLGRRRFYELLGAYLSKVRGQYRLLARTKGEESE